MSDVHEDRPAARAGILAEMTQPEVAAFAPQVVVVGVGSTEPHGPALPYGTDTYRCEALCRLAVKKANARGGRVLMYPVLPIGNNVNFKGLPFACRIGVRTLMRVLLDIFQALEEEGVRKIVLVNTHGGNTDTLQAVLREHYDRTPADRRAFICVGGMMPDREAEALIRHPSPHAGESETSAMLHIRPDLVREDAIRDLPIREPMPGLVHLDRTRFVRPWHLFLPLGGGGVLSDASGEKGRRLLESGSDGLADFLASLSKAPWKPGFPFEAETGPSHGSGVSGQGVPPGLDRGSRGA